MHFNPPVKGHDELRHLFAVHRLQTIAAGEVISGRLLPGLDPELPPLKDALERWPGTYECRSGPEGWELLLFEARPVRERWWVHAGLFLLTLLSTMVAGGLLSGRRPIRFEALPLVGGWWLPLPAAIDSASLLAGVPFALALVTILALHESGHYLAARGYRISVSPPYFIPFPPYISIIGTLGAFIRLRSPLMNRRQLLDVGVAGPLASFFASLPVLWWGLLHSRIVQVPSATPGPYLVRFASEDIWIGGSPAFSGLVRALLDFSGQGEVLWLHPVAFAGWLGLFVTALNLLPIAQLDGGHILYAALGSRQKALAWFFFLALIPLGFLWAGWWVWALLIFAVGKGRVGHPPVFNAQRDLGTGRRMMSAAAALIFLLCFVPIPFWL